MSAPVSSIPRVILPEASASSRSREIERAPRDPTVRTFAAPQRPGAHAREGKRAPDRVCRTSERRMARGSVRPALRACRGGRKKGLAARCGGEGGGCGAVGEEKLMLACRLDRAEEAARRIQSRAEGGGARRPLSLGGRKERLAGARREEGGALRPPSLGGRRRPPFSSAPPPERMGRGGARGWVAVPPEDGATSAPRVAATGWRNTS
jgi:hypothetical protein